MGILFEVRSCIFIFQKDKKIISMTKPKPKLENLNPGILKKGLFDKNIAPPAITSKIISIGEKKDTQQDTYEWISGGLFLHHRAGVSKSEVIELRGFM